LENGENHKDAAGFQETQIYSILNRNFTIEITTYLSPLNFSRCIIIHAPSRLFFMIIFLLFGALVFAYRH